jgi:hypothetical protein
MAINFLNGIDLNKNQLLKAAIENLGTDPATGVLGQLYYNTADSVLKICVTASVVGPPAVNASWAEVGGGVEKLSTTQTGNSTGDTLTVLTDAIGDVTINSFAYAGGSNIGYVPTGGTASKFLKGDGTWSTVDFSGLTLAAVLLNGNTTSGTDIDVSTGDDITFADESKAIFGDSGELEIYHNLTNSSRITASQFLNIEAENGYIQLEGTSGVKLRGPDVAGTGYDNYFTLSSGRNNSWREIWIHGDNDGVTNNTGGRLLIGTSGDIKMYHNGTDSYLQTQTGDLCLLNTKDDKSVLIKADSGTTAAAEVNYLKADGSDGSLKIYHYGTEKLKTTSTGITITGQLSMSSNQIKNVTDPTANQDAATKKYVDDQIAGVPQGTLTGLGEGTYIDIDNTTPAVPIINVEGTEAATASKLVARDSNGYGYVATPASGDSSTKIATTSFVQSAVTGLLEFKGGFNANTGVLDDGSGDDLYTDVVIAVGDYYVVTTNGNFFGNTATPLTVGDSVIAQNAVPNPGTTPAVEGDFIVVQSDTDLATETTVGLGNVNIEGAGDKDGLSLSYSSGTATLGLDINGLPNLTGLPSGDLASIEIPLYDGDTGDANKKVELIEIVSLVSSKTTYAATITDSVSGTTFNHGLGDDVIVQLYDATTKETVYTDVERNGNYLNITFASTPTNSIRVLVQKIG